MKFSWKVFFGAVVVTALAICLTGYSLTAAAFSQAYESECQKAVDRITMFCAVLENVTADVRYSAPAERLSSAMESVATGDLSNAALYDKNGGAIYAAQNEKELPRELLDKMQEGLAYTTRRQGGAYVIEVARPVRLGQRVGYLMLSYDASSAFALCERMLWSNARNTLLGTLVAGVVLYVLSLWLTRPVRELSVATKALAGGEYSRRAIKRSDDEIGDLTEDFNSMAGALEAQFHRLEEDANRRERFVASFAHELKTPLTSIIGYADTLRSRRMDEEQQFSSANYIFSEGRRLERLSFKLLELIVLGQRKFQLQSVLTKVMEERLVKGVAVAVLERYGVHVVDELEEAVLHAEQDLLATMLMNLVDNAAKASKRGDVVRVMGSIEGEKYCIRVIDEGVGIAEDELQRISEAFYMVDKSRGRRAGGAGLGMALCVAVADIHDAALDITSAPGKGTAVTVTLWRAKEEGE